jgi:hypothetical protein
MTIRPLVVVTLGLAVALPAAAQRRPDPGVPAPVTRLLGCRAITTAADRLACFDRESAVVGQTLERKELVVFDREAVTKTRRSLFGFSVPDLGVFGGNDSDAVKQIEGVLAATGTNRDGGATFTLVDGSRWTQIDDRPLFGDPKRGAKVTVKRGTLGAFILTVAGQPSVKVKRIG